MLSNQELETRILRYELRLESWIRIWERQQQEINQLRDLLEQLMTQEKPNELFPLYEVKSAVSKTVADDSLPTNVILAAPCDYCDLSPCMCMGM